MTGNQRSANENLGRGTIDFGRDPPRFVSLVSNFSAARRLGLACISI
jgi:hypothetical protein